HLEVFNSNILFHINHNSSSLGGGTRRYSCNLATRRL
uniref:Uncharacterized protein n=1 Tax=Aegilops tauschii subsp. strangulata TaxID=200361 RepID=A0A453GK17_AEGTS